MSEIKTQIPSPFTKDEWRKKIIKAIEGHSFCATKHSLRFIGYRYTTDDTLCFIELQEEISNMQVSGEEQKVWQVQVNVDAGYIYLMITHPTFTPS